MTAVVSLTAYRARRGMLAPHYCCRCGRVPVDPAGMCHACTLETALAASLSARSRKRIDDYNRRHHDCCARCGVALGGAFTLDSFGEPAHPMCSQYKAEVVL